MLKIKKCKDKKEWIVYNPHNFEELHTHCYNKRVACQIKRNVEKKIIPHSNNIHTLKSHLRVTRDKKYKMLINEKIEGLLNGSMS